MITLAYYYYSPILEKDTHCGIQYNDLQKVTKCLCIIPEKSRTVEAVLHEYQEKTLKEKLLLIVPDATEYNYEEVYFRKRFEGSIEELRGMVATLLQVPPELPQEIHLSRRGEKHV